MASYRETQQHKYWDTVAVMIGASSLKPARVTRLKPQEVQLRVDLTWQSHDWAQYIAVSGSDEQLAEHVRSPSEWRDGLQSIVWVFWDHAPIWCSPGVAERPLYSEVEAASRQQRKVMSRKRRKWEKDAISEVLVAQSDSVSDRPVQSVSLGSGASQKSRLTLIQFQTVEKWFDASSLPVGHGCVRDVRSAQSTNLHGVLIVKCSQHCRLSEQTRI